MNTRADPVKGGLVCLRDGGRGSLEEWEWPEERAVASGPRSFHLGGTRLHGTPK